MRQVGRGRRHKPRLNRQRHRVGLRRAAHAGHVRAPEHEQVASARRPPEELQLALHDELDGIGELLKQRCLPRRDRQVGREIADLHLLDLPRADRDQVVRCGARVRGCKLGGSDFRPRRDHPPARRRLNDHPDRPDRVCRRVHQQRRGHEQTVVVGQVRVFVRVARLDGFELAMPQRHAIRHRRLVRPVRLEFPRKRVDALHLGRTIPGTRHHLAVEQRLGESNERESLRQRQPHRPVAEIAAQRHAHFDGLLRRHDDQLIARLERARARRGSPPCHYDQNISRRAGSSAVHA